MPTHNAPPFKRSAPAGPSHPAWLPQNLRSERDQLFLTYLAILALANGAFAAVSWAVDYREGAGLHLAGLLLNLTVFALRWRGTALPGLVRLTQWTLLAQALALAWTSGGIFSPMLGWLAWASLPAVIDRSIRNAHAWIGGTALLILGLYAYALLGGEVTLGMAPSLLVHWHVLVALLILAVQTGLLYRFQRLRTQRLERMHRHTRLLHRMRNDLVHAQKDKDIFVASVSHELRTPMNAILGLADLIQHDKRLPDDVRAKVENIQKSSEHLLTIINDLLDYSQISAGALRIVHEPFDLHDTLHTAYTILEPRALTKPIRYTQHLGPNVPRWILGDAHRLTQVLVNLLGNAVKFTTEGFVSLSCQYEESLEDAGHGVLHIEVRDSGIGIPSENQSKLFGQFVQADASIARRFGGNGLGLSITRNLVEAMGGHIGVDSTAGQGSRFFISLPCQSTAPLQPRIVSDVPLTEQGPIRILIVDDNPLNRQVASLQLRRQLLQAEIDQAEGGQQAFEKIRDGHYDVVLLDLLMPDMDGFETAYKVRAELPAPQCHTPIIALTANNDAREHQRCLDVGMNESMVKPFDRILLSKKVLEHARRSV
ncbi:MAG: response regulator [Limnohabitans sp.]|nr:MAG: response regulator [Limnohabitans sp.]